MPSKNPFRCQNSELDHKLKTAVEWFNINYSHTKNLEKNRLKKQAEIIHSQLNSDEELPNKGLSLLHLVNDFDNYPSNDTIKQLWEAGEVRSSASSISILSDQSTTDNKNINDVHSKNVSNYKVFYLETIYDESSEEDSLVNISRRENITDKKQKKNNVLTLDDPTFLSYHDKSTSNISCLSENDYRCDKKTSNAKFELTNFSSIDDICVSYQQPDDFTVQNFLSDHKISNTDVSTDTDLFDSDNLEDQIRFIQTVENKSEEELYEWRNSFPHLELKYDTVDNFTNRKSLRSCIQEYDSFSKPDYSQRFSGDLGYKLKHYRNRSKFPTIIEQPSTVSCQLSPIMCPRNVQSTVKKKNAFCSFLRKHKIQKQKTNLNTSGHSVVGTKSLSGINRIGDSETKQMEEHVNLYVPHDSNEVGHTHYIYQQNDISNMSVPYTDNKLHEAQIRVLTELTQWMSQKHETFNMVVPDKELVDTQTRILMELTQLIRQKRENKEDKIDNNEDGFSDCTFNTSEIINACEELLQTNYTDFEKTSIYIPTESLPSIYREPDEQTSAVVEPTYETNSCASTSAESIQLKMPCLNPISTDTQTSTESIPSNYSKTSTKSSLSISNLLSAQMAKFMESIQYKCKHNKSKNSTKPHLVNKPPPTNLIDCNAIKQQKCISPEIHLFKCVNEKPCGETSSSILLSTSDTDSNSLYNRKRKQNKNKTSAKWYLCNKRKNAPSCNLMEPTPKCNCRNVSMSDKETGCLILPPQSGEYVSNAENKEILYRPLEDVNATEQSSSATLQASQRRQCNEFSCLNKTKITDSLTDKGVMTQQSLDITPNKTFEASIPSNNSDQSNPTDSSSEEYCFPRNSSIRFKNGTETTNSIKPASLVTQQPITRDKMFEPSIQTNNSDQSNPINTDSSTEKDSFPSNSSITSKKVKDTTNSIKPAGLVTQQSDQSNPTNTDSSSEKGSLRKTSSIRFKDEKETTNSIEPAGLVTQQPITQNRTFEPNTQTNNSDQSNPTSTDSSSEKGSFPKTSSIRFKDEKETTNSIQPAGLVTQQPITRDKTFEPSIPTNNSDQSHLTNTDSSAEQGCFSPNSSIKFKNRKESTNSIKPTGLVTQQPINTDSSAEQGCFSPNSSIKFKNRKESTNSNKPASSKFEASIQTKNSDQSNLTNTDSSSEKGCFSPNSSIGSKSRKETTNSVKPTGLVTQQPITRNKTVEPSIQTNNSGQSSPTNTDTSNEEGSFPANSSIRFKNGKETTNSIKPAGLVTQQPITQNKTFEPSIQTNNSDRSNPTNTDLSAEEGSFPANSSVRFKNEKETTNNIKPAGLVTQQSLDVTPNKTFEASIQTNNSDQSNPTNPDSSTEKGSFPTNSSIKFKNEKETTNSDKPAGLVTQQSLDITPNKTFEASIQTNNSDQANPTNTDSSTEKGSFATNSSINLKNEKETTNSHKPASLVTQQSLDITPNKTFEASIQTNNSDQLNPTNTESSTEEGSFPTNSSIRFKNEKETTNSIIPTGLVTEQPLDITPNNTFEASIQTSNSDQSNPSIIEKHDIETNSILPSKQLDTGIQTDSSDKPNPTDTVSEAGSTALSKQNSSLNTNDSKSENNTTWYLTNKRKNTPLSNLMQSTYSFQCKYNDVSMCDKETNCSATAPKELITGEVDCPKSIIRIRCTGSGCSIVPFKSGESVNNTEEEETTYWPIEDGNSTEQPTSSYSQTPLQSTKPVNASILKFANKGKSNNPDSTARKTSYSKNSPLTSKKLCKPCKNLETGVQTNNLNKPNSTNTESESYAASVDRQNSSSNTFLHDSNRKCQDCSELKNDINKILRVLGSIIGTGDSEQEGFQLNTTKSKCKSKKYEKSTSSNATESRSSSKTETSHNCCDELVDKLLSQLNCKRDTDYDKLDDRINNLNVALKNTMVKPYLCFLKDQKQQQIEEEQKMQTRQKGNEHRQRRNKVSLCHIQHMDVTNGLQRRNVINVCNLSNTHRKKTKPNQSFCVNELPTETDQNYYYNSLIPKKTDITKRSRTTREQPNYYYAQISTSKNQRKKQNFSNASPLTPCSFCRERETTYTRTSTSTSTSTSDTPRVLSDQSDNVSNNDRNI